jgi:succinate dehydrogenase / fumarate reductase cytochrome b subunit
VRLQQKRSRIENSQQDKNMSSAPTPRPAQSRRPKYYDLNLAHLPPPGLVSIFHRVSGALLFFPILPLVLYILQATLSSDDSYTRWLELFDRPLVKLVLLGVTWLYAHHFFAGIRYLLLDLHIGIEKAPARTSAIVVLALGLVATALIGWRLW